MRFKWFVFVFVFSLVFSLVFSYEDTDFLFALGCDIEVLQPVEQPSFIPTYLARVSEDAFEKMSQNDQVAELKARLDQIEGKTPYGDAGVSTTSAIPRVPQREWILSSDILYWQARLEGTQYAARRSTDTDPTLSTNTSELIDFKWDFGFRLGLGTVVKEDRWDLDLQFTYFNATGQGVANEYGSTTLTPLWTSVLDTASYTTAKSTFSMSYSDLLAQIGRSYFISTQLSLRPNFGVRSAWIRQRIKSLYSDSTNAERDLNAKNSSNMWGIGPRLGLSGQWFLFDNLHFTSGMGMSFLYSYFQLRHVDTLFTPSEDITKIKEKKHRYIPSADLFLGIAWGRYINERRQYLNFAMGYDLSYFWNQNQVIQVLPRSDANSLEHYQNANNDLSCNGFTAKVQLNF